MARVLVAGALSGIAVETIRRLIQIEKTELILVARKSEELQTLADDLKIRGALSVEIFVGDLCDIHFQKKLIAEMNHQPLDIAYLCWGVLGDDRLAQSDPQRCAQLIHENFVSMAQLCTLLTPKFETQKKGTIAIITSVAGDRGRQSNYVYGSAKAGMSAFAQGLRNRLHHSGVRVMTIKPGPVRTPMIAHLKTGILTASPRSVGEVIARHLIAPRDILYAPWYWRWIMLIVTYIPEFVFKKLRM